MNEKIFREYDIRGIAETDLPDSFVSQLAEALATFYAKEGVERLSIGRDCRKSSERLKKALVEGLVGRGISIVDIGLVPTPMLYFSLFELPVGGGIMITGSHNPGEYNGFKICLGKTTIHGEQIQELKRSILNPQPSAKTSGDYQTADLKQKYIEKLASSISQPIDLKVVLDGGNGMAGVAAPELLKKLGCEVIELYSTPDGNFPNHHPDPTEAKNLEALIEKVQQENATVGIGFDGDADRIGAVDASGRIIYGDELLLLYSREVLEQHPGAKVISEVKASQRLFQDVKKHGGEPIMWKTGHSLIKAKMKESGALIAGEMSGHMFFGDRYFGYDDAIYAAARLVELIARHKKSPGELLSDVPASVTTPEIRVDCPDETKFEVVEQAKRAFESQGLNVVTIDGARVEFQDGWGLVRASNTQPVLVYRFEATTEERLGEIRSKIQDTVAQFISP